ncbi:MAG: glycosyltransferase family 9 protein [Bacteroidia bacterium]|nr:glycosyltransferase family 9 protein [Bacteroidia bacterium]MDW8157816.1 glycosyltransferase family 9 protein [Bacteroidia bacterium]
MHKKTYGSILISRTDSIGDVILTLPLCGFLKELFPSCNILFLGTSYTLPILERCKYIDMPLDWQEIKQKPWREQVEYMRFMRIAQVIHVFPRFSIAKLCYQASIPIRIGTSHRLYHWWYCNRLVPLGRKNSFLHEAELNIQLLKPLTKQRPTRPLWHYYGIISSTTTFTSLFEKNTRPKIILHPGSRGSAKNWPLNYWHALIELLIKAEYQVILTGSAAEADILASWVSNLPSTIYNLMGKLTLSELIDCIAASDLLVAASTGPLHIAAALGKFTVGLYVPLKPLYPQRWAPLGEKAYYLVSSQTCRKCTQKECPCMLALTPKDVFAQIQKLLLKN